MIRSTASHNTEPLNKTSTTMSTTPSLAPSQPPNPTSNSNPAPKTNSRTFSTYAQLLLSNLEYTRPPRADEKPKLQTKGAQAKCRERLNWDLQNHGFPNLPSIDGKTYGEDVRKAIWDWAGEHFPEWKGRYIRADNDPLAQVKVTQYAESHTVNKEKERVEREKEDKAAENKMKKKDKKTAQARKDEVASDFGGAANLLALSLVDYREGEGDDSEILYAAEFNSKEVKTLKKAVATLSAEQQASSKTFNKRTATTASLDKEFNKRKRPQPKKKVRVREINAHPAKRGTFFEKVRQPGHTYGWQRTKMRRYTLFPEEKLDVKVYDYVEAMMDLPGSYYFPIDITDDSDEEVDWEQKEIKVEVKVEPED